MVAVNSVYSSKQRLLRPLRFVAVFMFAKFAPLWRYNLSLDLSISYDFVCYTDHTHELHTIHLAAIELERYTFTVRKYNAIYVVLGLGCIKETAPRHFE